MRILVVDDEEHFCDAVADILTKKQYTVDKCYDSRKALQLMMNNHYDIVFSDLMMPYIDGYELLDMIRAKGKTIPFVVMTAAYKYQEYDIKQNLYYLEKPLNPEALIKTLDQICDGNRSFDNSK